MGSQSSVPWDLNGVFWMAQKWLTLFTFAALSCIVSQCNGLPSEKKKCWNFKAVFQRNSAGIPEVNIWNQSGILMKFHWNTGWILPLILFKFTACFPELFRWNTTHFLAEITEILMEFLWYFDGILVEFWWNSSQKSNAKGLTCGI